MATLNEYVSALKASPNRNFNLYENSKSLLESIAKEISKREQPLDNNENVSKLLRLSFGSLGNAPTDTTSQIGQAIARIGQEMGNFRNEVGTTSHGRTLDELRNRTNSINSLTDDFLIFSTELVCCFLIEAFETDNPLVPIVDTEIAYDDNPEFNERWDEIYGKFRMTDDYIYPASQILFNLDFLAYKSELSAFNSSPDESEDEE